MKATEGKCVRLFLTGTLCILLIACTPTERQLPMDLKARIEKLGDQAEEAFLAGDIDRTLGYYCDDVISMPNFYPMVRGKADLKRQMEAIAASGLRFESLESTTLEVRSGGEYVYEVGIFSQTVIMPNVNEPILSSGKYVTIWRRQPDESLKIAVEIYNSNDDKSGAK